MRGLEQGPYVVWRITIMAGIVDVRLSGILIIVISSLG
jgi:hypothetical protein